LILLVLAAKARKHHDGVGSIGPLLPPSVDDAARATRVTHFRREQDVFAVANVVGPHLFEFDDKVQEISKGRRVLGNQAG
jgi:hypothetical protein